MKASRSRSSLLALLALLGGVPPSSFSSAQVTVGERTRRLNAPIDVLQAVGFVHEAVLSPAGTRMAFVAESTSFVVPGDDGLALFAGPSDGSQASRVLSPAADGLKSMRELEFTADGEHVLFRARPVASSQAQLGFYSVPFDGSSGVVELTDAPLAGTAFREHSLTPDGLTLVHVTEVTSSNDPHLFARPIDGSAPALDLAAGCAGVELFGHRLTADGVDVLYQGDCLVAGQRELFRVPVDGSSAPVRATPALPAGASVTSRFHVTPDRSRIVYTRGSAAGVFELFVAPYDGPPAPETKLSGPMTAGGDVLEFQLTPDGVHALYVADQDVDGRIDLYRVPVDGSASPMKLNGTEAGIGTVEVSPDGLTVAYVALEPVNDRPQLYSVPLDGSAASLHLSAGTPDGTSRVSTFAVSPDSSRVVYLAWGNFASLRDVFSVPLDGSSAPVQLGPKDGLAGDTEAFWISDDGARVVLLGDQGTDLTPRGVLVGPIDGSSLPALVHPTPQIATIVHNDVQVAGGRVLFRTDLADGVSLHLYGCADALGAQAEILNDPFPVEVDATLVREFELSPDGAWAAYLTDDGAYAVPLATSGGARKISAPGPQNTVSGPLRFSADSSRVHFHQSFNGSYVLSALVDGGSPPTVLWFEDFELAEIGGSTNLAAISPVGSRLMMGFVDFQGSTSGYVVDPVSETSVGLGFGLSGFASFTPDGATVAYRASEPFFGIDSLWSRPADGSTPATSLTPVLNQQSISHPRLAPGGARIVYRAADDASGFATVLRSVPVDGSTLPITLATPSGSFGIDTSAAVTQDGSLVVFAADLAVSGRIDLWVVPIDGSAAPLQLNASATPAGDVLVDGGFQGRPAYLLTPDGTRVVFAGDQDVDGVIDLYVVPLDASAPPIKLSPTFGTGNGLTSLFGSPAHMQLSPDGARVVFRAEDVAGRFELFSTLTDGSAPAVRLHAPLSEFQDVTTSFACLPDSSAVLFTADFGLDGRDELWLAPIDGSSHPVKRSGPPRHASSDVRSDFAVSADGRFAVFRSDRGADERDELWSHPIEIAPRSRPVLQRHP